MKGVWGVENRDGMEKNAKERGSGEAGVGKGLKKGAIDDRLNQKCRIIQVKEKNDVVLLATQNCFFPLIIIMIIIIIIFIIITIKFVLQKTVIR